MNESLKIKDFHAKGAFKTAKPLFLDLITQNCHRAIKGFLGDGIYTPFRLVYSRFIH